MGLLPFEKRKPELLVKRACESDPSYGSPPEKRTIEELLNFGVINLNKPSGPTSHMCSDYVQKILHVRKAGHGGSLDPGVTGVLPMAIGRATRVVQALLKAGKEYVCAMHLHSWVSEGKIRASSKKFVGKIKQLPPLRSAVKRQWREREIYYLEVLEVKDRNALFKVGCEAGTYIRRLCEDWGKSLGTRAHMASLIRTKAGPFSDSDWVTLQELEDAYAFWKEEKNESLMRRCIKPVEFAVSHLPKVWVLDSAVDSIAHGASLNAPGVSKLESDIKAGDTVAVLTLKNELISLGRAEKSAEEILELKNGKVVTTQKVFMLPGVYQRVKG